MHARRRLGGSVNGRDNEGFTPVERALEFGCNDTALLLAQVKVRTATRCNTLQNTATHCNTLQRTAARCDMLRHA